MIILMIYTYIYIVVKKFEIYTKRIKTISDLINSKTTKTQPKVE